MKMYRTLDLFIISINLVEDICCDVIWLVYLMRYLFNIVLVALGWYGIGNRVEYSENDLMISCLGV